MTSETCASTPRQAFCDLMREHRAMYGRLAHDAMPAQGAVELRVSWGKVDFKIGHSARHSHLFRLSCRFGPLPSQAEDAAMWRLLAIQRELMPAASSTLGLDEDTGDVWNAQALPVLGISAAQLDEEMQRMYARALEWRRSFFLDDAPAARDSQT